MDVDINTMYTVHMKQILEKGVRGTCTYIHTYIHTYIPTIKKRTQETRQAKKKGMIVIIFDFPDCVYFHFHFL
jgi:hypothetical protein